MEGCCSKECYDIIHLPEEFLGKKVEVEANEVKLLKKDKKEIEKNLREAFEFFKSISVDMSKFKFRHLAMF